MAEKTQDGKDYIFSGSNEPFKTEAQAEMMMKQRGLDDDQYAVIQVQGGFAISLRHKKASESVKDEEKFYRVMFHDKSDANQPDDVTLTVNNQTLLIPRGQETIVPERYIECAQHAIHPQIRQVPGEKRKVVGWVQTFPFTIKGPSTREAYEKMRKEGTLKTMQEFIGNQQPSASK